MDTITATRTEQNVVHDWRFIEFVMRTWTDAELAEQYRQSPIETMARYGLCAPAGANAGPATGTTTVTVDDIDHPAPLTAAFTLCG